MNFLMRWLRHGFQKPRMCGECRFRRLRAWSLSESYSCANAESPYAGYTVKPSHLACEKGKAR